MKRIFLSGWYGCGNTGDEAILLSMMDGFTEILGEVEFIVLSENPERILTTYGRDYNIKSLKHYSFELKRDIFDLLVKGKIFSLIGKLFISDIFILGGGGILRNYTP